MRLPLPSSLRGLVTLIVLFALLPAIGLLAFSSFNKFNAELYVANRSALRFARNMMLQRMLLIENTQMLLVTLSQLKEIQQKDSAASADILATLQRQTAAYADLYLCDDKGSIIASSNDTPLERLPERVLESLTFNAPAGTFSARALFGNEQDDLPMVNCQLTAMAGDGSPLFLIALVRIWISPQELSNLHAHEITSIRVADANGRVLFRISDKQDFTGRIEPNLWKHIQSSASENGSIHSSSGGLVLYQKVPEVLKNAPDITLVFTTSTLPLKTMIKNQSLYHLGLFGLVLIVVLMATVYLCRRTLIIPMKAVLLAAKRIKDGDLSTHIGDMEMPQEMRMLADSLDSMTRSIKNRDRDLINASEAAQIAAQSKTDFLANMSHELRTPMNAILGMAYLTTQEPLSEHQLNYIETIRKEADRLLVIINDILDFSKIEAGRLHVEEFIFPLSPLLKEIVHNATLEAAAKNIHFTTHVPVPLPEYLCGDPHYLRQLISNLCSAAVKISTSGEIQLRCVADVFAPEKMLLEVYLRNPEMKWSEKTISKFLFSLENQNRDNTVITGADDSLRLNLALSQNLALLLGGYLTMEPPPDSQPEQGYAITLRVPFSLIPQEELEAIRAAEETTASGLASVGKMASPVPINGVFNPADAVDQSLPLKGIKVLVAEDNPINQQIAEEILTNFGAEVRIAEDGIQALSLLENGASTPDSVPYHVVLMDLQMPKLDGLATTNRIRLNKRYDILPIIAMTAHRHSEEWEECANAGMDGFISKPFDVSELLQVIQRWSRPGARTQSSSPVE